MKTSTRDAVAIAVCLGAAAFGSLSTGPAVATWYQPIRKPPFLPPHWLFGPAWATLCAMMAVAAWLVWRKGKASARTAPLVLFGVQLALNAAWSPVFFGLGTRQDRQTVCPGRRERAP